MIGLVLAALAVGYSLWTGRFSSSDIIEKQSPSPSASVLGQDAQATSTPTPNSTSESAYDRIVDRTQGGVQALPRTGFPMELAVVFSISTMISGWGLRKFPK